MPKTQPPRPVTYWLSDSLADIYVTIGVLARAISQPSESQIHLAPGPDTLAYAQAIQTLAATADQLIAQANALDARAGT